jgi:hypothetical protein
MKTNIYLVSLLFAAAMPLVALGEDAKKTGTVNEIAAKPSDYLGAVRITGVVATVNAGKGFLLVDQREYSECGLSCLKESGTKKIPVQWGGESPKVEQLVRVEGTLRRSDNGLAFTADKVEKR